MKDNDVKVRIDEYKVPENYLTHQKKSAKYLDPEQEETT